MGTTARAGLVFAMIALLVGFQLLERELARWRRTPHDALADTCASALAPLEERGLPPPRRTTHPQRAAPSTERPDKYVVQRGDTLAKVAKKVYGSESEWKRLYDANRAAIPDLAKLQVGATLRIPRLPARPGPAGERPASAR